MHSKKTIENFMHPLHHYYEIREDENIAHAIQLISKAAETDKMPYLIVTGKDPDADRTVTGFVSSSEIVFGVAGHFLKGARRVGPMVWEGLLETETPKAVSRPVSEIMVPISACISDSRDILEAIFLFNKHSVSFLPVIRSTEVIGLIHMDDILNRLMELLPHHRKQGSTEKE